MEHYLSVREMLDKLKGAGILIDRANMFLKIKNGVIKPQAYTMIGKRRYPKYSIEYVNRLIACATVQTRLDWSKVKQLATEQGEPQKI